jgi:CHAD domain-containing protein
LNETVTVPRGVSQVPTELLERRFARQAAEFASAAARVRGAQDPQALHDLRSSALTLEAMLGTWSGLLDPRPRLAALRGLRRLRRRLGRGRRLEARTLLVVALCAPAAPGCSEPVLGLLDDMRRRLRERTARAARCVRPRRLQPLWERIGSARASLAMDPGGEVRAFDRARAYLLGRRAMARVAVEMALAHEDDWLLRRSRSGVERWRHALECMNGARTPDPDPGPVLRRLEEILDAALDRAALVGAIERRRRDGVRRGGFEALLGQLRAEKQVAFERFRALATAHGAHSATRSSTARIPRVTHAPGAAHPASSSPGERWERMAQWLLGKGRER